MRNTTPSEFKAHWGSRLKVMQAVLDGMDGKPFYWETKGATQTYLRLAREMGVTLVTKNQIEKAHHVLKRDVKPVGKVNFGGRFGEAQVYVLEVQTSETEKAMRQRHETKQLVFEQILNMPATVSTYTCVNCGRAVTRDEKLFGMEDGKCKACRAEVVNA